MLVYPSSINLSGRTLRFLTGRLTARRQEIGTRWRRLPAGRQALLALAHLRCGDTYARLAAGFGIGIATAYRYIREAVDVLAALAPTLAEAMHIARTKAFVILDGTLLPIDRIAADPPYYSGKHKRHGMNIQVLTDPFGRLLWASRVARLHPRPDRRPHSRDRRSTHRRRPQVLGRQGLPGRRRLHPGALPQPSPQAVAAPPQQHTRQNSLPRRAGHGHPEGLASPTEAPLQHQPHHSDRPGRPRPSPRVSVRLERAQWWCPRRTRPRAAHTDARCGDGRGRAEPADLRSGAATGCRDHGGVPADGRRGSGGQNWTRPVRRGKQAREAPGRRISWSKTRLPGASPLCQANPQAAEAE